MPPGDALTRLLELQSRPASPGITGADIARVFELAGQAEAQAQPPPLEGATAQIGGPSLDPYRRALGLPLPGAQAQDAPPADPMAVAAGVAPAPPAAPIRPIAEPASVAPQQLPVREGVGAVDPRAGHPETLAEPGTPQSSVQAPQEITPLQGGFDPRTNDIVFTAPGVPGEIRLPANATPDQIADTLIAASSNWSGQDVFAGHSFSVSRERAAELRARYNAIRSQLVGQGGQAGGPLTTAQIGFEQQVQAPVSPENRARLAAAQAGERQAQAGADAAALGVVDARTQGFQQRADLLQRQAEEQAQQDARVNELVNRRLAAMDSTIQSVMTRQVNPDAFFGPGLGGRIVPAIAVALGEIARGLTGQPNAAMAIIDSAINRSMQAQERNLSAGMQQAQLQGQALAQFRQIVGDERGAQAATRAAHYAALLSEIDGQITRASGQNLAALQGLRNAVTERMNAEMAVAQDRARFSGRIQVVTQERTRDPRETAGGALRQATTATMASDAARQPQTASSEAPPTTLEQAMGGSLDVGEEIDLGGGLRIPVAEIRPMGRQARDVVRAAQRRLQSSPRDRQARETVAAARRAERQAARGAERAARARLPRIEEWDADDARAEAQRLERWARGGRESGAAIPARLPRGFRWMTSEEGVSNPQALYAQMWDAGEQSRQAYTRATTLTRLFNEYYPRIVGARAEYGGELTSVERQAQLASQMAANFRDLIARARTGAAITQDEEARYLAMMPDPREITAANVAGVYDRVLQAWENWRSAYAVEARATLEQFGVTTDSAAGNATLTRSRQARAEGVEREESRRERHRTAIEGVQRRVNAADYDRAVEMLNAGDRAGAVRLLENLLRRVPPGTQEAEILGNALRAARGR